MKYISHPNLIRMSAIVGSTIAGLILGSTQLMAAGGGSLGNLSLNDTTVTFQALGNIQNSSITVTGPRDFVASQSNGKGGVALNLQEFGELDDGLYRYQITSSSNEVINLRKNRPDNGRGDKERDVITKSKIQSGHFRMKDGSIVIEPKAEEENVKKDNTGEAK